MSTETKISSEGVTIGEYNDLVIRMVKNSPSLIDQFAMAALQGILSNVAWPRSMDEITIAKRCYSIAEAMIQETKGK